MNGQPSLREMQRFFAALKRGQTGILEKVVSLNHRVKIEARIFFENFIDRIGDVRKFVVGIRRLVSV